MTTTSNELCFLTIGEASGLIKDKKLSPVELTQAYLDRMGAIDGKVKSYVTPLPESALQEARVAEADIQKGNYHGPLHGVPIGLKDLYDTKGVRTTGPGLQNCRMKSPIRVPGPTLVSNALSVAESMPTPDVMYGICSSSIYAGRR